MSHQSQYLYEFGPFRLDVMERRLLLAARRSPLLQKLLIFCSCWLSVRLCEHAEGGDR